VDSLFGNTVYAYRNRMRNRAIDREHFEENVLKIGIDDNWEWVRDSKFWRFLEYEGNYDFDYWGIIIKFACWKRI